MAILNQHKICFQMMYHFPYLKILTFSNFEGQKNLRRAEKGFIHTLRKFIGPISFYIYFLITYQLRKQMDFSTVTGMSKFTRFFYTLSFQKQLPTCVLQESFSQSFFKNYRKTLVAASLLKNRDVFILYYRQLYKELTLLTLQRINCLTRTIKCLFF